MMLVVLACGPQTGGGGSSDDSSSGGETGEPMCGDGKVDPGEGCDDGQSDNHDGCDADCQPSSVVGVVGRGCVEPRGGAVRCWGPEIPSGAGENIVGDDEPAADAPILEDVVWVARGYWANQAGPPDSMFCVLRETGAVECRADAEAPLSAASLASPARTIAAYDARACAVGESGELYCWGQCRFSFGAFGAGNGDCLGYGSGPMDELTWEDPVQPIPIGVSVKEVALGTGHACVLSQTGEVKCWGTCIDHPVGCEIGDVRTCFTGRCLGDGNEEPIGDDEPASMGVSVQIEDAVQLGAIDQTTCVRLADGSVSCWGMNADGSELIGGGWPSRRDPVGRPRGRVEPLGAGGQDERWNRGELESRWRRGLARCRRESGERACA